MSFFSVHSTRADIEDLMSLVAQRLHAFEQFGDNGSVDTTFFPSTVESGNTYDQLRMLTAQWSINSTEIIHSTRPVFGSFIIRFQRIVRRFTWWYLNPIIDQIIAFNGNAVRILTAVYNRQETIEKSVSQLSDRLGYIERKLGVSTSNGASSEGLVTNVSEKADVEKTKGLGIDLALATELQEIRAMLALANERLDALEKNLETGNRKGNNAQ